METVTLPDSLLFIDDQAFYACRELAGINFPEGPIRIGGMAFTDCSLLQCVELPGTLTELGDSVFF